MMESTMIQMVPVQILFYCGLVFLSVTATKRTVTLELKTTGCEHNCVIYDKGKCLSSVKVNGEEYSPQEDGFNVVIIDNYTGQIKTDYFRWFSRLSPFRWKAFRDFFMRINSSSTVIVVFQNMCSYFDKAWYKYLRDSSNIQISHIGLHKYNTAILVGCKMSCPKVVKGAIPFNYYGVSNGYGRTIAFHLSSKEEEEEEALAKKRKLEAKKNGNIGSVLGGIIAVLFIICIAVILYISYKRQIDWKNYLVCLKKDDSTDEDEVMFDGKCNTGKVKLPFTKTPTTVEQPEYAPIYPSKTSQSNEHIYEYINPENLTINRKDRKKPREAENEYYTTTDAVHHGRQLTTDALNHGSSQGISSICSVAAGSNPPAVFDPDRHSNGRHSNMKDSGSTGSTQPVAGQHPASSRNDEMWYDSPESYRKGNYRNSPHTHRL